MRQSAMSIRRVTYFLIFMLVSKTAAFCQTQPENLKVVWQPHYKQWLSFTDNRNSLYSHFINQAMDLSAKRDSEILKINSLEKWQERQELIKETLLELTGPFPSNNPLNAKTIRTIRKEGFRVEHIVYESQPGLLVTSSLFIPDSLKRGSKNPAIVYCSGHTVNSYRAIGYQHVILNLVKKGFIVFAFDPNGQGERIQYFDVATGKSIIGQATYEHSYPGAQAFISGNSQARYFILDGMRAVDYLLTRKEVDPLRIGITGQSGGGVQSAFIAAIDDRIYATAPQCFITSNKRLFQSIGPQDAEQIIFNGLARGIDHADFLAVRAPRPALLLGTTEDMFSIQGLRETAGEVELIYKAYGKEENFGKVEDAGRHGYTKKTREAMYAFFQKHLNNPGNSSDELTVPLSEDEMKITPTGQLSTSLGGETIFSRNAREAEDLAVNLEIARIDLEKHLSEVPGAARKLSGYLEPGQPRNAIFTGQIKREGYIIEKYFIEGEGGYIIPYLLMKPEKSNAKALIYLHPSGKEAEAGVNMEMEMFTRLGYTVLAPDLIGIGEMGPGDFLGDSRFDGIGYNTWFASVLVGKSIIGVRAGDVIRLARILHRENGINMVYGMARKEMGAVLLHAAAFESIFSGIALVEPFSSYMSIVNNRFYSPHFIDAAVPGALGSYDLPDLAASLAPARLLLAGVTDATGKAEDKEIIKKELEVIVRAYKEKNCPEDLEIIIGSHYADLNSKLKNWFE